MAIAHYLNEVGRVIELLRAGKRAEAELHTERAELLMKDIPEHSPLYEDCLILNTMLRDVWNPGVPTDIADLQDQLNEIYKKLKTSTSEESDI